VAQPGGERLRRPHQAPPTADTFPSLDHLIAAIIDYLDHRNQDPKPFVWTATVESILAKLRSCMPIAETIH
jgi:hypothetical protein